MNCCIFGSGVTGKKALDFLGWGRVKCFVDNKVNNIQICDKEVISFEKFYEIYLGEKNVILVIASEKYWREMEQQVRKYNIELYFVFHERDIYEINTVLPFIDLYKKRIPISYTQVLSYHHLNSFQNIAVYGVNRFLPYLLLELMEQAPDARLKIINSNNSDIVNDINFLGMEITDRIDRDIDCLLINVKNCEDSIRDKLSGYEELSTIDLYNVDDYISIFQHKELKKFKNIHQGKRVFVLGNGPSLTVDDLNTLHRNKEICIAFNRIFKIYDRTEWRADYVGFTDPRAFRGCADEIMNIKENIFVGDNNIHCEENTYIPNANYFHLKIDDYYPNYPSFSDDFTKGFYRGSTVVYDIGIQLAAYMGFKEIYLLGVDCSVTGNVADSGNHFIKDYFSKEEKAYFNNVITPVWEQLKSYEKAEMYSREHGFQIYNATRGGKLEIFERVNFDDLFFRG